MGRHRAAATAAGRTRAGRALVLTAGVGSVMGAGAGLAAAAPSLDAVRIAPTMPALGQTPSAPDAEELGLPAAPNLDPNGSSAEMSGAGHDGGGTVSGHDIAAHGGNALFSGTGEAGPGGSSTDLSTGSDGLG